MKKLIMISVGLLLLVLSGLLWVVSKEEVTNTPNESDAAVLPYTPPASTEPPALFDELVDATPDLPLQNVLNLLYLDVYEEYQCPQVGAGEQALLVTAKYTPNAEGLNTLDEAQRAVAQWESSMLADVGHLLFPSYQIGELDAELVFAAVPGTSMRSAATNIGGKDVTIAYSWLLNYVVIATSLDCLEATMKEVYEYAI